MKSIYFISDVHLAFEEDGEERAKREKLLGFCDFIMEQASALYILGDLFDFWFEWHHVVPGYWFPILHQLRKMVDAGIAVHFTTGNHDFYTGDYLQKEIGLVCHREAVEFSIGGKRFFAAHGDGLAKKDRGYRLVKRIIRHRFSIFCYRNFIPADIGMFMARLTSRSSRKLVKIDRAAWGEEYFQFARQKFREGFDYVLLGHIHQPMHRQEGGKVYVNCGDWLSHFTYARFDGRQLTLNHWQ
jgi:UDP-2,3-diacylglucosamine hydrolase